jgi:alpha-L-rhamnosidase
MARIASLLGADEDERYYAHAAEKVRGAYSRKFLSRDRLGTQTPYVLGLYGKMAAPEKLEKYAQELVTNIVRYHDYHFDTGIHGTLYLPEVLDDLGRSDVVYRMLNQESYPGFGYMLREGATTLWERWEYLTGGGVNSHNHIMLGSVDTWFFKTLCGLRCEKPGWQQTRIQPFFPPDMTFAAAKIGTPFGNLESAWEKREKGIDLIVTIPPGMEAVIAIPRPQGPFTLYEKERPLLSLPKQPGPKIPPAEQIRGIEIRERMVETTLLSGRYCFRLRRGD